MSKKSFTFGRKLKGKTIRRLSNNAKSNKALNRGRTAAQMFYLLWTY